jgi:hypothetical protein
LIAAAQREPELAPLDTSESDTSVVVRDEPCDRALDDWTESPLVLGEVAFTSALPRLDEQCVVSVER